MKKIALFLAFILILNCFTVVNAETTFNFTNGYETFSGYGAANSLLSDNVPLNGGAGFDGEWYDSESGTVTNTGHYFKNSDSPLSGTDVLTYSLNVSPLTRKFATPIDFSVAGEYYVEWTFKPAYQTNVAWMTEYNVGIKIGEKIRFGAKSVAGKTVANTSPYMYPFITIGDKTVEKSDTTDDGVVVNQYHKALLKIIANGNGNINAVLYINGVEKVNLSGTGLTKAETLSIEGTGGIRIHEINFEGYSKESLDEVRNNIKTSKSLDTLILGMSKFGSLVKTSLVKEYSAVTNGRYLYENFETYSEPTTAYLSEDVKNRTLDNGVGFSGGWYDNANSKTLNNSCWLRHHSASYPSTVYDNKEVDLMIVGSTTAPLMRDLESPIDFSKAGEYYLEIKSIPAPAIGATDLPKYDLGISLGDSFTFGIKGVDGKTVPNDSPYLYPYITAGGVTTEKSDSIADGVYTSMPHEYFVKIVADGNGNADISFSIDGTEYLMTKASGLTEANSLKFSGYGTTRLCSIYMERYSKEELDAIRNNFNNVDELDNLEKLMNSLGTLGKRIISKDYANATGGRYVYEGFENYADKAVSYLSVDVKNNVLDSGIGFGSPWYDNQTSKILTNSYWLRHHETSYPSKVYDSKEVDLLMIASKTAPLTRTLAKSVDFSKAGEYYLRINLAPANGPTVSYLADYDFCFSLGNDISFGLKGINGKTIPTDSPYYYPYITTNTTSVEKSDSENDGAHTSMQHELCVKIIADGEGNADVTLILDGIVTLNADAKDLTVADFIKISGSGSTRVCDIFMETYTGQEIFDARTAIDKLSKDEISYEDALLIVNKVTGLAHKFLLEDLNNSKGYVSVVDGKFVDASNNELLEVEGITDSVFYSFKLYNNYIYGASVNSFIALYENNKLLGVKMVSSDIDSKDETDTMKIGFDKLPELKENGQLTVKFYVWDSLSQKPYMNKIEMPYQGYRAVQPTAFGDDSDELITVAFMGDSITHMDPSYSKWIEYYYRIKYPEKNLKFVNKGISGETCANVVNRFEWDVLNDPITGRPTDACLMIGMNDVERWNYPDGSAEVKQTSIDNCLANIRKVVKLCEENNVRLTLITPGLYDEDENYTPVYNYVGVNEALSKVAKGVIEIANENKLPYIDFNGTLNRFNTLLRAKPEFDKALLFNVSDRVHLTPQGTFAAGFVFINQQLNDPVIASVDIDATSLVAKTEKAEVSEVSGINNGLSFKYAPKSLPFGVTEEYGINEKSYGIPVTDTINREIIKVRGLESGNYNIMFGDVILGTYSSEDLEKGVNIATLDNNPGQVQALELYNLLVQKTAKDSFLRGIAHAERGMVGFVDFSDVEACIQYVKDNFATSTEERYIKYESNKRAQASTVAEILSLESQMKIKSQPGVYNVRIIRQ